jgi:High-affinity nickel-transport protein
VDTSLVAALGVGFMLGLRHALEPDHVAAVSSFVSQERGVLRSCLRGVFWGIGHTAALMAAGVAIVTFKLEISPRFERTVDTVVALVLILLGGHVVLRAASAFHLHHHAHAHDGAPHSHLHVHVGEDGAHGHFHPWRGARQPLLMGLLHGLAGGGALVLLVMATIPSPAAALLYIAVFGVGSTAGMLVLSGLIGLPFALTASGSQTIATVLQALVGAGTVTVGVVMLHRMSGG